MAPVSSPTAAQPQVSATTANQAPPTTSVPTSEPPSTPTQTRFPPTPIPTLIPADPDVLKGLREMVMPFDTAEPSSGFDDLEPFREIVGDARIVALGEATHGTSEFFQMKHRLTELLVTEMGFTIFAIEAPWPATKVINHYVHNGDATRSQLLDGLTFWPWQTQEVLDLIEWMRAYNMRPGVEPISFQAFDMQLSDDQAVDQVLAFVNVVDPARVEQFADYYDAVATGGAEEALDDLLEHRDEYTTIPSPEPYEAIVQTARMIVQFEEYKAVVETSPAAQQAVRQLEAFELRDRYMAENVTWLLGQAGEEAKIILWAHNGHVAATGTFTSSGGTTVRTMGSYLREHYGDGLIVVGFDFFSGTFIARGKDSVLPSAGGDWVHEIPLPSPESIEYTFAQLGLPRFILDLRSVDASSPAGAWLLEEHPMWAIGAGFNRTTADNLRIRVSLPHPFDVLVYFHDTHASHPLF